MWSSSIRPTSSATSTVGAPSLLLTETATYSPLISPSSRPARPQGRQSNCQAHESLQLSSVSRSGVGVCGQRNDPQLPHGTLPQHGAVQGDAGLSVGLHGLPEIQAVRGIKSVCWWDVQRVASFIVAPRAGYRCNKLIARELYLLLLIR